VEATSAPRPPALRIRKPRRLLSALSDERLVDHVRRGEPAAFEVLYDRYSAGILGFCRHMLGSTTDAEDATQQTFISAHADIQRHDRRELHVKAWLYTIARNRCLSMLRARREQPSDDDTLEVATDDLLHDVEHRDDIRALLGDIAKLPDDQREALVLAEVGDLSHSDIGAILGCEASKVKSLVFQARTALVDRRTARETPCAEIREQLATLRGGALRRSHLRHHLEACPGCTQYREEIRRQRAMLALALPVVPSAALRAKVFGGLGFGGSTAAAGGVATSAAGGGIGLAAPSGLAAKVAAVAVLAAGGAGGATVANHGAIPLVQHPAPAVKAVPAAHGAGMAGTSAAHTGTTAVKTTTAASNAHKAHPTTGSRRSARGSERGFTPVTGQSNGASARAFAQTRGKGKETSAARRHTTAHTRARPVKPKHVATPRNNATKTQPLRTQQPKSNAQAPTRTTTTPETTTTTTTPTPTVTEPASTPPATTNKGKAGKGLNGLVGATG
jgi:RNA polymerase sigma factor (sigma-70 family)